MILILSSNTNQQSGDYQQLIAYLAGLMGVQMRVHVERGAEQTLTEIYLIGNTKPLDIKDMQSLPCVERVVRVSEEYRILGQHKDDPRPTYFDYNGVRFGQDTLNVFAGLCAVDNAEHVEIMLKALRDNGRFVRVWERTNRAPAPMLSRGMARIVCLLFSIWRGNTA